MVTISNFKPREFYCGEEPVPEQYHGNLVLLMTQLQVIRNYVGKPIKVTSGYRTFERNMIVGGAMPSNTSVGSRHLYAQAADIKVVGISGLSLHKIVLELKNRGSLPYINGIGMYNTFCHVDIRSEKARWANLT